MSDGSIFRLSPAPVFWVFIAALAAALLFLFSGILLPFAAGFVLAYLFHPVASGMQRIGIPRGAAAFLIVGTLMLALAAFVALIVPPLAAQLGQLIENLPGLYERAHSYIFEHYGQYLERITGPQKPGEPAALEQLRQHAMPWLQEALKSGAAFFNSLALLFLTPMVAFFLLRDWDKMIAAVRDFLPKRHASTVCAIAGEIDSVISAYLRGTLIVLCIVSGFYMVALGFIGLQYGLLIGFAAGFFSFVPYLGAMGGFLVSGGVALSQFWPDYTMTGLVCGVFVLGQLVEGNLLTPNIVGSKVGLHPLWLLFALVASGYLFGFAGLVISVPLAAAIGVLVRYAVREYYESPLHNETGRERDAPGSTLQKG